MTPNAKLLKTQFTKLCCNYILYRRISYLIKRIGRKSESSRQATVKYKAMPTSSMQDKGQQIMHTTMARWAIESKATNIFNIHRQTSREEALRWVTKEWAVAQTLTSWACLMPQANRWATNRGRTLPLTACRGTTISNNNKI